MHLILDSSSDLSKPNPLFRVFVSSDPARLEILIQRSHLILKLDDPSPQLIQIGPGRFHTGYLARGQGGLDDTILYSHDTVGRPRNILIVCNHDNGLAQFPVYLQQKIRDHLRVDTVEFACGLVGQEERGIVGECRRYSDSLLLSTAHLIRLMVSYVEEPYRIEKLLRP